jgi:hypothetical protein
LQRNKIPVFVWRGEAAPNENWEFIGILFYGKPLNRANFSRNADCVSVSGKIGAKLNRLRNALAEGVSRPYRENSQKSSFERGAAKSRLSQKQLQVILFTI